jgi:predicted nucleic acid-binding protein
MHRIDANILLRYLLDDHEEHSRPAAGIIENNCVVVSTEVVCEVVYVLSGVYSVPRAEIRDTLHQVARHPNIEMMEQQVVCHAADSYTVRNLDFVDALLLAHHQIHGDTIETFDRKLTACLQAG